MQNKFPPSFQYSFNYANELKKSIVVKPLKFRVPSFLEYSTDLNELLSEGISIFKAHENLRYKRGTKLKNPFL